MICLVVSTPGHSRPDSGAWRQEEIFSKLYHTIGDQDLVKAVDKIRFDREGGESWGAQQVAEM